MAADPVILGIIIGVLAAILYSLRVLILVERRIARLELNIEVLVQKVFKEEQGVENEEEKLANEEKTIGQKLGVKGSAKKSSGR